MPSRSHGRCKVCRAITHIDSRFGMCAVHMRQRNKRIAEERKAAKARKARRQQAQLSVLEEGPAVTEEPNTPLNQPGKIGRPHQGRSLTDDERVEILDAYTKTDESVQSISARFGIKDTYIYNVLDRVGVSWRRSNPESYETWQARQAQPARTERDPFDHVPPETEKALENMLRMPPAREPVAPAVDTTRRPAILPTVLKTRWAVEVSGTIYLDAQTIEAAVTEARRLFPGTEIKSARQLD